MAKRLFAACIAFALCVTPASAQTDLSTRVAELERLTAQHSKELQALRSSVDALDKRLSVVEAKLPGPSGVIVAKPADGPAPHLPTPPCPNCQCGCTETGQCTCKDCDHPARTPPVKKTTAAVRYWTYAGSGVVYGSDGSVSSADGFQTLAGGSCSTGSCSVGASYYSSYPAGIFTSSGSGGCASGSCGSSGRGLGFFRRGR
jgi:hypothetical protein